MVYKILGLTTIKKEDKDFRLMHVIYKDKYTVGYNCDSIFIPRDFVLNFHTGDYVKIYYNKRGYLDDIVASDEKSFNTVD